MNLTQAALITRRIIKYGAFFLVFLIIAQFAWKIGFGVYRKFYPEKPPPPTVAFGRLPKLSFPAQDGLPKFSYVLQTPTGVLPTLSSVSTVYFMPQNKASFLALEEGTDKAQRLGFSQTATSISETIYKFQDSESPISLDMNIVNKTFSISYNLSKTPELLTLRPESAQEAINTVTSYLSRANLLPADLSAGRKTSDFIKIEGGALVRATSLSEANFIRVNLFRADYNNLSVATPDRQRGNVWFLVSGDRSRDRVIAGEYHYFPVSQDKSGTYPLKTAQMAWDELVAGQGFVIQPPSTGSGQVIVRRVALAYYDSGRPQEFLQPVVVFEGDGDFVAYVPAITPDYYGGD